MLAQAAEDVAGDVVTAVAARGIAARHEEERGGVLDHDASRVGDVCARDTGAALLDLDLARHEVGRDLEQARGLVLAASSLGKALGGFSAAVHARSAVASVASVRCRRV